VKIGRDLSDIDDLERVDMNMEVVAADLLVKGRQIPFLSTAERLRYHSSAPPSGKVRLTTAASQGTAFF
jgi:hypothetical protein